MFGHLRQRLACLSTVCVAKIGEIVGTDDVLDSQHFLQGQLRMHAGWKYPQHRDRPKLPKVPSFKDRHFRMSQESDPKNAMATPLRRSSSVGSRMVGATRGEFRNLKLVESP
jgi:hypothetical protein